MRNHAWTYILFSVLVTYMVISLFSAKDYVSVHFMKQNMETVTYPTLRMGDGESISLYDVINKIYYPPDAKEQLSQWLMSWQPPMRKEAERLVDENVTVDDPRLIDYIKKVLVPPSKHKPIKTSRRLSKTPQAKEALVYLNNKHDGFFIECGAFDGERSSNTIYMEEIYGWTGLLVEMDSFFFTQLLGKNRNAYSINACLSPYQHPTIMYFAEHFKGQGMLLENNVTSSSAICYPLYSILLALNVTKIDFFSLDVEGFELPILKTIPWDKLDIEVLTVEYKHGEVNTKEEYKSYMEKQGYRVYRDVNFKDWEKDIYAFDYIFVKNR